MARCFPDISPPALAIIAKQVLAQDNPETHLHLKERLDYIDGANELPLPDVVRRPPLSELLRL